MRSLTNSEKRLLMLCFLTIFLVVNLFGARSIYKSLSGSGGRIKDLERQVMENGMILEEKPLWDRRQEWLDARMKPMESAGKAQGELAQELRDTLFERKLRVERQTLVEPVTGPFFDEVAVTMRIRGNAAELNDWLTALQSPERFVAIKALELKPDDRAREQEPQGECDITVARWFLPKSEANLDLTTR